VLAIHHAKEAQQGSQEGGPQNIIALEASSQEPPAQTSAPNLDKLVNNQDVEKLGPSKCNLLCDDTVRMQLHWILV